ncbi:hypothetical protein H0H87_006580 [Tephrocybe sp. NHM501043]|nr:hypothetical protein H0H87_006580 [Tephrocybe sp. NHM501043]
MFPDMEYPSPALSTASPPYALPTMPDYQQHTAGPVRSHIVTRSTRRPAPYRLNIAPSYDYDPMTPSSTPSPYPPPPPAAASPAPSCGSSIASARPPPTSSSASAPPITLAPKPKQRKQRLDNSDRKRICLFHQSNPSARQEDIAAQFGVERSTISKILKQKAKWLNSSDTQTDRVAKHRSVSPSVPIYVSDIPHVSPSPSKFPEIEEELRKWLVECSVRNIAISDASIRDRAKQVARALDIPEDKFKASSGWVDNFKTRAGVQKGVCASVSASASSSSATPDDVVHKPRIIEGAALSPLNPAFVAGAGAAAGLEAMSDDEEILGEEEDGDGELDVEAAHQHSTTYGHTPASSVTHTHMHTHTHTHTQPYTTPQPPSASSSLPPTTSVPAPHPDQEYYLRTPQHIPTLAEAEAHINALLLFFDMGAREDLITVEERDVLQAIKVALFEEAGGINPFGRG